MKKNLSLFQFMRMRIGELRMGQKYRTAETYTTAMNSFRRFLGGKDIHFRRLTQECICKYESWLLSEGIRRNTTSFYMRILRAVYNQAVDRGYAKKADIFKHVYTGVDKTGKRAIDLETIRIIKRLDLSSDSRLAFARDMFLFSLYTRGMSFVDMAFLRRSDLRGGELSYARSKTGQRLKIRWEDCMQEIVDWYPANTNGFLLPIISKPGTNFRSQYRNTLFKVNSGLRTISEMIGLGTPITTYVARHTWASVAYSQNVPISVISEGLGHDSERTTRIYLSTVGTDRVDRANNLIISLLH
ncbi:MAG: site-specific integrase [Bacteroidales bacterium]|nr:site-specific integrase [Bacteroidales bacterium]